MKFLNAKRLAIFAAILVASILFGILFDVAMTAREKKKYPINSTYADFVTQASKEFGVPESVLWAVCKEESNFASGLRSSDGKIGLMQISPALLSFVSSSLLETNYEVGMLYDPETNLRVGAAYLSYLYERYGIWGTVFAAYRAGTDQVDTWLKDEKYVSSTGRLRRLPSDISSYVTRLEKALSTYQKLYDQ